MLEKCRFWFSNFWGGAWCWAFLTNSQVTLLLLVWEAHFGEYEIGLQRWEPWHLLKCHRTIQNRGEYDANLKYHESGSKYCANLKKRRNYIWYGRKCSWRRWHLESFFFLNLYYLKKYDCDIFARDNWLCRCCHSKKKCKHGALTLCPDSRQGLAEQQGGWWRGLEEQGGNSCRKLAGCCPDPCFVAVKQVGNPGLEDSLEDKTCV